jgi:hypothetical protein
MRALGASRTSVATGGILGANWARDPLWKIARAVPGLDLRFAENKSLTDANTGASLVTFTRASTGTFVGSNGLLQIAATDVPRFDHNPITGESLGLLVEDARTNLLRRSEEFNLSSIWGFNGTVSGNAAVSPDGLTTAEKLNETSTTGSFFVFQGVTYVSGNAYTLSVYAKKAERNFLCLRLPGSTFGLSTDAYFNLNTGTVGTTVNSPVATISDAGNGWYRCSITKTATASTSGNLQIFVSNADATTTYTGTAGSAIYIWGAQLEIGSTPSSYIPTVASAVTRAADVVSIGGTNFSSWYNQTEGTVFVEWSSYAAGTQRYLADFETATLGSSRIDININTSNVVNPRTVVGGTTPVSLTTGTYTANTSAKVAFACKVTDYAASLNGATPATNSSIVSPPSPLTQLFIGSLYAGFQINGRIKRFTYWPTRLSNAALQVLTAP